MTSIQTVNPTTETIIKTYPEMSASTIDEIIHKTHAAYLTWRDVDFATRSLHMKKLAALLTQNKNECAKLITSEMGKPLAQSISEIEKCALVCNHYAESAQDYLKPRSIPTELKKSYVTYQPIGIIFAIMPWNFPFWQVFRAAVPTIMAGNAVILKHAPISTGTAFKIETLFRDAGFNEHLFRTVVVADRNASPIITHPKIAAITLTGSVRAGKTVAALAAGAMKKTVLELGGNDPYVILADADLELAATQCVTSRMNNAGQSCIAAKRIIAVKSIQPELAQLITAKLKQYKMGDPEDPETTIGPLARADLRDKVHNQVQQTIAQGATLIMGGDIPSDTGFYYPPTLLTNVKKGMTAYDEEVFGPVISIITAENEDDAIHIANDSLYGLGAGIFSKDIARAEKIAAEKIQSGSCAINGFVASDPRLPFGGIKESGFGRELAQDGIHSFVNVKTITVK